MVSSPIYNRTGIQRVVKKGEQELVRWNGEDALDDRSSEQSV